MKASSSTLCTQCRHQLQHRLRLKILTLRTSRLSHTQSHPTTASWYWETLAPTPLQLAASAHFIQTHPARRLWSATEWRTQNQTPPTGVLTPEIAFLGRSNVGKSSLLNALLNTPKLNPVGSTPGKTKHMSAYGLSATDPKTGGRIRGWKGPIDTRVMLLDAPGYGFRSQTDWGAEIIKYLKWRKQLRRVFVLLDAQVGLKKQDREILVLLRKYGITHQLIATKADKLGGLQKRRDVLESSLVEMREASQPRTGKGAGVGLGEILVTGSLGDGKGNDRVKKSQFEGLNEVRWSVLRAAGLEEYAVASFGKTEEAKGYDDAPIQSMTRPSSSASEVVMDGVVDNQVASEADEVEQQAWTPALG